MGSAQNAYLIYLIAWYYAFKMTEPHISMLRLTQDGLSVRRKAYRI